jgi:hypothetical protein
MLKIEARIEGARILVVVTAKNGLDETLYLQNWLFDWYGLLGIPELHKNENKNAPPTRELAFTALSGPGEMLLLSGDGPPPADGILPYSPRVPYATRLSPNETYQGRIVVPLPVLEWHAYDMPQFEPTRKVRVRSVRYRLETVRESHCKTRPREHVSFKGVFIARSVPSEILEARAFLPQDVELLERTDNFKRFG